MYDLNGKCIWVAGHRGMVGSAVVRRLASENCTVLTATRQEVDFTRQADVERFVADGRPDAIVLAAAKVGGIFANDTYPGDFLYENLLIETSIFGVAHANDVDRLLFLGWSCIYPRPAPHPIEEDAFLTGPLEPTNGWYAIAKIAGIKLARAFRKQHVRDYISAMHTNLSEPGNNFDLNSSHVLPALILNAHEANVAGAPTITLWGTGTPRGESLHADDCAHAFVFLLKNDCGVSHVNVGLGGDLSILELAQIVCNVVGFKAESTLNRPKPDGTPCKLVESGRHQTLGGSPRISVREGLAATYEWYLSSAH